MINKSEDKKIENTNVEGILVQYSSHSLQLVYNIVYNKIKESAWHHSKKESYYS